MAVADFVSLDCFMESRMYTDFKVRFSGDVVGVLECEDAKGTIEFTLDAGSKGDRSICLQHHPANAPRGRRYELAFAKAKQFLESCGYEVETRSE
jgi:hypothetical protein